MKKESLISPFGKQSIPRSEIQVILVDPRRLFRQGLIALFTSEPGILVAGDAGDGLLAIELIEAVKPDVVVLNLNLPGLSGLSITTRARKLSPPPEVVILTGEHNETQMREVFRAGARAYLLQDCDFKELVFAIRKASMGDYYLSGPAGHEMVLQYVHPTEERKKSGQILTKRERELARLLAEGCSTKEAADCLRISVKTAETHRASVMKKLSAKNVTDIVRYCIRNKTIDP